MNILAFIAALGALWFLLHKKDVAVGVALFVVAFVLQLALVWPGHAIHIG